MKEYKSKYAGTKKRYAKYVVKPSLKPETHYTGEDKEDCQTPSVAMEGQVNTAKTQKEMRKKTSYSKSISSDLFVATSYGGKYA